jgi:DNA polymerase elongation subunit (family B)
MKGIFIDCYRKQDKIMLWIREGNKNLRLEDNFTPKIYVKGGDLRVLKNRLFYKHIYSRFVKKNSFYKKDIWALEIPLELSKFNRVVKTIEKLENYNVEIYNADLKLEEYYMFEKDIFPLAKVEFKVVNNRIVSIKALDEAEDIYYDVPDFKVCKIKAKTQDNLFKGLNTKLEAVLFNKKTLKGNEKDILLRFKREFEKLDPDILWIENGNLVIPLLKEKLKCYGLNLNFNRFEEDNFYFKQGCYHHSYSKIVFRTNSIFLKGRLHFDMRSFFADDTGFHGIIDGSRICRQRIQRTEMRSAGAAVTNFSLYIAHKRNYLLPYKVGIYERFKTLYELYNADRGSMIFEPRIGFHTDVAEFDFISLYPNIMNKYNLSPETLFCKCCKLNKVPGLHYNYCRKVRGIIPIVADTLIKRRIGLKQQNTAISKEKVDYLKWLLVTIFGYQAFKNRKIGTIENHESIQAYARETIMKAVRTAELHDWEVIHGIIDSIYVKKNDFTDLDIQRLGREIYYSTGLELKHEGNYRWIVFLPSVVDENMPVSSHFYGVFEEGEIKYRGIEARRKDAPKIVADMQTEMIGTLAKAKTEEEFRDLFPKVFEILKNYVKVLPHAAVEDLMIIKTISKLGYVNDIAQKLIIEQMKKEGYGVQPGMTISYVIRDLNNKDPCKRYVTTDSSDGKIDIKKYTELMVRATFSILQPFGVTEKQLNENIDKLKQLKITQYNKKLIPFVK